MLVLTQDLCLGVHSMRDQGGKGYDGRMLCLSSDAHPPASVSSMWTSCGPCKVHLWPRCLIAASRGCSLPKGHSCFLGPLGKPFLLQFSFPHRLYTFQLHNSEWQYSGSPPLILLSVAKSCLTLCNPVDCSPSGSSVHGISQARILEWVAISCATGSSRSRDQTCISSIGRWILYH